MSTPLGVVDGLAYQMKCDFKMLPSFAFKSIIKFNPLGQFIQNNSPVNIINKN